MKKDTKKNPKLRLERNWKWEREKESSTFDGEDQK